MKRIWISTLVSAGLITACSTAPAGPPATPAGPGASPSASVTAPSARPSALPSASPSARPGSSPSSSPSSGPGPALSPSPMPTGTPPASLPAQLRLSAATRFLSAVGASLSLVPELLDTSGKAIEPLPALSWRSSRPQDLAVDQSGRVTALSDGGFSEISVSLPGGGLQASLTLSVSGGTSGGGGGGGGSASRPQPPVIRSLTASSSTVTGAGVPVELRASADGDASFSWRCLGEGCGDFVSTDAATVLWRSPAVPGSYTLEVSASRNGLSTRATIRISVLTGSASVEVVTDPG